MTRFGKHLDLSGYQAIREMRAEAVRGRKQDLSSRAGRQVSRQKLIGAHALAAECAGNLSGQIRGLGEPDLRERFAAAAEMLATTRRIYCLGLRASFPVVRCFHYVLSLVRDGTNVFDGTGGLGVDGLRNAASDDVLLVARVHPYTRATVEAIDFVATRGIRVVAITDSSVAPLAKRAQHLILVETASCSSMRAMALAFSAAESLAALVAGRSGANAVTALRTTENQLAAFNAHINDKTRRITR